MKMLPLLTFNEVEAAQDVLHRLREAGIPAALKDESHRERFWFLSEPLAAIHVEVEDSRFLKARSLVREWEPGDVALQKVVRCPECRSSRVEYPQITRKFLMPGVQAVLMAMHLIPREFYCLDCQFTWPKEPPHEPELDPLGWPYDSKFWHPERFHDSKRH